LDSAVEEFRVSTVKIGGVTRVAVVGELHEATRDHLASAWAEALSGDGPVVLDLEACTFIDSIGLDLILRTATQLRSERRELVVCNVRGPVRELFRITGAVSLDGLLVYP
jgi:anti-anti-sigma factor